jgi:hypothetical protein
LHKEIFVTTTDPSHDAGSERITSAILVTAILFSIYIAMFLAVAFIVHVLTLHDAAAGTVPASSMASAAAAASRPRFGLAESPPSGSLEQVLERTDNSRECRPNGGIESDCIYN